MLTYVYKFRASHNSEFYTHLIFTQNLELYFHIKEKAFFFFPSLGLRGPRGCSLPNNDDRME